MALTKAQLARFWNKVRRGPGCWLWRGAIGTSGYGQIAIDGRARTASRVAWEITKGEIPAGLHVLHTCDRRACVRPDHLWLGSNAENVADKVAKGRAARVMGDRNGSRTRPERRPRGQRHWRATVSDRDVRRALAQYARGVGPTEIARALNVNRTTVQRWVKGVTR